MEARLLKAFFDHREYADSRARLMSSEISNINTSSDLLISNLERRVMAMEKNLWLGGRRSQA